MNLVTGRKKVPCKHDMALSKSQGKKMVRHVSNGSNMQALSMDPSVILLRKATALIRPLLIQFLIISDTKQSIYSTPVWLPVISLKRTTRKSKSHRNFR